MTDRERAIVMAYTGIVMLNGEKFSIFHKYVEEIMGRPVWTHEMGIDLVAEEIKEKAKPDFLELCGPEEEGEWLDDGPDYKCSKCGTRFSDEITFIQWGFELPKHCPECGIRMKQKEEES